MKNSLLLFFFLLSQFCFAQNLVPNPSFEDTVMCPDAGGQVSRAQYWQSVRNTPDYLHSCCAIANLSVPSNIFGYQYPSTGDAYMGIWEYQSPIEYNEAIGTYLTTPLTIGQKYFVTFKVCLGDTNYATNVATDKFGMLFSTIAYNISNPPPLNNFAHVYTDSIISDSIAWTLIQGSFIADSVYTFISIGNFFNHANIDTLHLVVRNYFNAYYFIDDLCVSTDSLTCNGIVAGMPGKNNNSPLQIFPNPVSDWIEIKGTEIKRLTLYDALGRVIYSNHEFISPLQIDVSSFARGIYFVKAETKNGTAVRKIVLSP